VPTEDIRARIQREALEHAHRLMAERTAMWRAHDARVRADEAAKAKKEQRDKDR
jgi:hypothetical protein